MKSYEKASQKDKRWQGSSFNFSGLKNTQAVFNAPTLHQK